jgi:hypothetical protein
LLYSTVVSTPFETTDEEVMEKPASVDEEVKPEDKEDVDEETVDDDIEVGVALPDSITEPN